MTKTTKAPISHELTLAEMQQAGGGLPLPAPEWKYVPVRR
jgi:hypothetical protein